MILEGGGFWSWWRGRLFRTWHLLSLLDRTGQTVERNVGSELRRMTQTKTQGPADRTLIFSTWAICSTTRAYSCTGNQIFHSSSEAQPRNPAWAGDVPWSKVFFIDQVAILASKIDRRTIYTQETHIQHTQQDSAPHVFYRLLWTDFMQWCRAVDWHKSVHVLIGRKTQRWLEYLLHLYIFYINMFFQAKSWI